jgi:hypothetical protein
MVMKITFCGWKSITTKPLVRGTIKATVVVQYYRVAGVLAGFQIKNFTGIASAVLQLRMDLILLIKWSLR